MAAAAAAAVSVVAETNGMGMEAATKAGNDEETGSTLYVGDLAPDVTEPMLLAKFAAFGEIVSVHVRRSSDYASALVEFRRRSEAERALQTRNLEELNGRQMLITWKKMEAMFRTCPVCLVAVPRGRIDHHMSTCLAGVEDQDELLHFLKQTPSQEAAATAVNGRGTKFFSAAAKGGSASCAVAAPSGRGCSAVRDPRSPAAPAAPSAEAAPAADAKPREETKSATQMQMGVVQYVDQSTGEIAHRLEEMCIRDFLDTSTGELSQQYCLDGAGGDDDERVPQCVVDEWNASISEDFRSPLRHGSLRKSAQKKRSADKSKSKKRGDKSGETPVRSPSVSGGEPEKPASSLGGAADASFAEVVCGECGDGRFVANDRDGRAMLPPSTCFHVLPPPPPAARMSTSMSRTTKLAPYSDSSDTEREEGEISRLTTTATDTSYSTYSDSSDDDGGVSPRERWSVSPRPAHSGVHEGKSSEVFDDFCVRSLRRADYGRREIEIAEKEMPGLMELRRRAIGDKPLTGAKIVVCTHINAQTAVFVETLVTLGARVRWSGCNIHSTQDEIAAALVEAGLSVYGWKGQTVDDFFWCIQQCVSSKVAIAWQPSLLLDDGGDATQLCAKKFPAIFRMLKGVVEDNPTGVHRLYHMYRTSKLSCPAMNVADSVVKSRFDSYYGPREAIADSLKKCTELMLAGRTVAVLGYGSVGKACALGLKAQGCRVLVTEIDPICALQASMDGFKVAVLEAVAHEVDVVVSATGNRNTVRREHMDRFKSGCIVAGMGLNAVGEVDVKSIQTDELTWVPVRNQVDHVHWPKSKEHPQGKHIVLLAEGRRISLFSSAMSAFSASVAATVWSLALLELYTAPKGRYAADVYVIPKLMDEFAAFLHLDAVNGQLSKMTEEQEKFSGVNRGGPFKPEWYRY